MGRRRELTNVGDGTTGHFMLDGGWNPGWQFAHFARALRAGDGTTFTVDLLDGAVSPASPHLRPLAAELQNDLQRHLVARSIPSAWVTAATFEVDVGDWTPGRTHSFAPELRSVMISEESTPPHAEVDCTSGATDWSTI
jgi:hypothetical protein